jgi:hypothetical protein
MFTIRNLGGVALFLFGTTFLWLTPSFATKGISTSGVTWTVTAVLSLVTLAEFTRNNRRVPALRRWAGTRVMSRAD